MFINNKYYAWYKRIIAVNDTGLYIERHHIIPRSLGGNNDVNNLVYLSYRKHFIAHWLLIKCTEGSARRKMYLALHRMTHSNGTRIVSSWQYAAARRAFHNWLRGNQHTLGYRHTEENKAKISAASARPRDRKPEERVKRSASVAASWKLRRVNGTAKHNLQTVEVCKQAARDYWDRWRKEHPKRIKLAPGTWGSGSRWINNGQVNRRIHLIDEFPPVGWNFGRVARLVVPGFS